MDKKLIARVISPSRLWIALVLLLALSPARAAQPNGHTLGGLEQFPIIGGTSGYSYATSQDLANFVGAIPPVIGPTTNLSPGLVTDSNSASTQSAATWMGYLTGTSNPNPVVFGGAASLNAGGVLSGTFTGSPTLSGSVSLTGGGNLSGTFLGSPTFSGSPIFNGITGNGSSLNVTATGGSTASTAAARFSLLLNVRTDFGAVGDGSTDDTTAFTNAISATQALGYGATLSVPKPSACYKISSTLAITNSIRVIGEGYEADSSSANGPSNQGSAICWSGGAAPMITVKSATASNYLWGGELSGLKLIGNSLATYGVKASSVSRWRFDLSVQTVTTTGLLLDDGNGVLSQFNDIPYFRFIYGSAVAVQGANGIELDGTGGVGVTQNVIGHVSGLVYNGAMIKFGDADNNHIEHAHASIQSGGTGNTLSFGNGIAHPARNNLVQYVTGPVFADSATYGNRILHYNAEAGKIVITSGGQLYYQAVDNVSGLTAGTGVYITPPYYMCDEKFIPAGMMQPTASAGATRADVASLWPGALAFAQGVVSSAGIIMPPPLVWNAGTMTGIRLYYTMDAANTSANVRLRIRMKHAASTVDFQTPTVDDTDTVAVTNAAYAYTLKTQALSSGYSFSLQDLETLRIDRVGTDVLDTASGNFLLLGVGVRMQSSGPTAGNGGTYSTTACK